MSHYQIILDRIQTASGCFYEMEQKTDDNKKMLFFALKPSGQFCQNFLEIEAIHKTTIQKTNLLRHYQCLLEQDNKIYYLFDFLQGKPIKQIINLYRAKQGSISIEKINNYLKQLLEALYNLHKLNILGRVFSVENILEYEGNITLMDFGFAPEIKKNELNMLAPPDVIFSIANNNDELNYGIEIDSWLLGAFLFNLIRLHPIYFYQEGNKYKQCSNLQEYKQFLQQQEKKKPNVQLESSRYPKQLILLTESLLKYDPKERLSFMGIYKSEYVQELGMGKCEEQISFYKNLNLSQIQNKIQLRDGIGQSQFISTGFLQKPSQELYQQLRQSTSSTKTEIPKYIKLESVVPPIYQGDKNSGFLELPCQMDKYELTKFDKLFSILNLEQFRFYILINTAEEVVSLLSNKKFGLENAIAYFLKKMAYIIMIEILGKLNSQKCQWIQNQQEWEDFQIIEKKENLIKTIKSQIQKTIKELQDNYENCLMDLAQNAYLDENLKNLVKQDKSKLQDNIAQERNIFGISSFDFLKCGFRNMTQYLYNFLVQKGQFDEMRTKQYSLILKTVLCHLINRIFDYDQINTQFKLIKPEQEQDVTPNQIYKFIESKDNDQDKIKEIQYLVNKYFSLQANNL